LRREPIKCVCECLAYSDISGGAGCEKVSPDFTTVDNLCNEINAGETGSFDSVPIDHIWGDEPFGDLPFAKRYRPFSYNGQSERGLIRIWKDSKSETSDIAQIPGSMASILAKNMAVMARIYTTDENRIILRDHLKKRYSSFKGIFWYPSN
jgi:hypothetical protein